MNYHQQLPNNLNTFRILFIVYGAFAMLFSLFGVLYAGIGSFVFNNLPEEANMPFNPGHIFMIVGICITFFAITSGTLCFFAAKCLKETKGYTFILIVSILVAVTGGILGILLCVFTLIEINKPHIKGLFYGQDIPAPSPQRRPAGNDGTV